MSLTEITVKTDSGEKFYPITNDIKEAHQTLNPKGQSGVLFITVPHTSCGLLINENYDPSAQQDMEEFLKRLAPRNASFITHTAEGEDDSPSHMKSILTSQNLTIMIEQGNLKLGQWQGVFLDGVSRPRQFSTRSRKIYERY